MINLGKISILLILIINFLRADFTATVNATQFSQGDEVVLTLTSTVNNNFPIISDIDGESIIRQSQESATSFINGVRFSSYKKYYFFIASKNITIPSFTIVENGKQISTKPIKIKVKKLKYNDPKNELFFKAYSSKTEVFVGEPFFVTLIYKQALNLKITERVLNQPTGKHFWIDNKPIESASRTTTHNQAKLIYVVTALQDGKLTINPSTIKVGTVEYVHDAWGNLRSKTNFKTLFTEALKIRVKPLPKGVENIGNFTFKIDVNKKLSNEKDAVNLTITINGEGNIVDIPAFKLPLNSVLVYDEAPKRKKKYKNKKYFGTFTQKFAIVSDHNYTIPSLSFSFYNLKDKKVVTLKSDPINITIKPTSMAPKRKKLIIQKSEIINNNKSKKIIIAKRSWIEFLFTLIFGLILGFIATKISWKKLFKKSKEKINISDEKKLLQTIIPFASIDIEAKNFVEILSDNIYNSASQIYDKKELKKMLKRLNIKV